MFVCFGQVLVGSACTACLFALVMVADGRLEHDDNAEFFNILYK